jgi:hypothetical protein
MDNSKRAGRQASFAHGTEGWILVYRLFSVSIDLEGIEFFRADGNAAAAAAAYFRFSNYRSGGDIT